MFKKIMAPVDLTHQGALSKALRCAAELANQYDAEVVFVGVTAATPGSIAHNPKEYGEKLAAFAAAQAQEHGIRAGSHPVVSHDPAADMNDALLKATGEIGADLVVMASHLPNVMDHIWPSHGGKIAEYAKCSVFVVRP